MKKIIIAEAIALFALVMMFAVYSANAETVVEKQQDGSYLVKERTEKTVTSIPPLPKGINFDEKVVLRFYTGKLPRVIVEGKKEQKITSLFPPTSTIKSENDVRVELVNGEWKLTELPAKPLVEVRETILFWFILVTFNGVLLATIKNKLPGKSLAKLLTFYVLLIIAAVVVYNLAVDNTVINGFFAVIIALVVVVFAVIAVDIGNGVGDFSIVAVTAIGVFVGVLVAVIIRDTGTSDVIRQYIAFLVVSEVVSFLIATGMKKIRDNRLEAKEMKRYMKAKGASQFL